eukprot:gene11906-biopygen13974
MGQGSASPAGKNWARRMCKSSVSLAAQASILGKGSASPPMVISAATLARRHSRPNWWIPAAPDWCSLRGGPVLACSLEGGAGGLMVFPRFAQPRALPLPRKRERETGAAEAAAPLEKHLNSQAQRL